MKGTKLHYGYVIVACCCLIMGVNVGLTFSCAGIFFQPVSEALGVPVGEFSIYISVMYVTSALMLPLAGKMMERGSARWCLAGASALMGAAFVLMACATSVWAFYVAGTVLGVTLAFLMYLSFPTLVNRWFHTRVGVMIGICAAASGLGGMLFNPVAGALIGSIGWRYTYGCFAAVILLIVTPLLALLLRNYPEDKGLEPYGAGAVKQQASASTGIAYEKAVKMPALYAVAVFSLIMMGVSTLNLFVPPYAQGLYGLEQASLMAAVVMGGAAVGKVVLGWINDRNCMAGLLVTTLFGMAGLVILVTCQTSLPLMYVGAFLFGWEYSGVTVQTAMITKTIFGTRNYARIYSLVSIALAAGGALASGGWGLLADATGYSTVMLIGAVVLAVGLVIAALALRSRSKTQA